jgi:hypothetical protein
VSMPTWRTGPHVSDRRRVLDQRARRLPVTEGNPNSGISETVGFTGYLYARGIAGTNATATLTYKF